MFKLIIISIVIQVSFFQSMLYSEWIQTNGPTGSSVKVLNSIDNYMVAGTHYSGIFSSTNSGYNWSTINNGFPVDSHVTAIGSLEDKLIAGTYYNGVYLSIDHGANWTEINNGLTGLSKTIFCIETVTNEIFLGTANGVFYSSNYGQNWSERNFGLPYIATSGAYANVLSIKKVGEKIYAGLESYTDVPDCYGIYYSTNSGLSWKPAKNGLSNTDGDFHVIENLNSDILAGCDEGLFLSTNQGTEWVIISEGLSSECDVISIATKDNIIFAGLNSEGSVDNGGIYATSNKGVNWYSVNDDEVTQYNKICDLFVFDNNIWAATDEGIFFTSNNGNNWNRMNSGIINSFVNDIYIFNNDIWACNSNGIFLSQNDGMSWSDKKISDKKIEINCIEVSGSILFAGSYGNGIYRSSDSGNSWRAVNKGIYKGVTSEIRDIISKNNTVYAASYYGIYKTTNSRLLWKSINSGLPEYPDIEKLDYDDEFLYAISDYNGIYKYDGSSWLNINNDLSANWLTAITLQNEKIYLGDYGEGVFLSSNSGANWIDISSNIDCKYIVSLLVINNNLYAGTKNGIYCTTNDGINWFNISEGLTNYSTEIRCLFKKDNTLYAGTDGTGVWKYSISQNENYFTKNVDSDSEDLETSEYFISQNFPNPFNPTTKILFSVKYAGIVNLIVYNSLGEVILEKKINANIGKNIYQFDGSDLASGIYFYKLNMNGFSQTKKMILMK